MCVACSVVCVHLYVCVCVHVIVCTNHGGLLKQKHDDHLAHKTGV